MRKLLTICAIATMASTAAQAGSVVEFETFKIRNNDGSITAPFDSDISIVENAAGDGFAAATPRAGQKVGYGTNAFDGLQLNTFNTVTFNTISGIANNPFLNFWVTDGTNHAIISSENDYRGENFLTRAVWKVFEYDTSVSLDWLLDLAAGEDARRDSQFLQKGISPTYQNVTLADFKDTIVLGQPAAIFPGGGTLPGVGTGAPRGGFGFNVIFGDTQANFVGTYDIDDLVVTVGGMAFEAAAIPTPAAGLAGLVGFGLIGVIRRRRSA